MRGQSARHILMVACCSIFIPLAASHAETDTADRSTNGQAGAAAQTATATSKAVAAAVRTEVQSLHTELKTLRETVSQLQLEVQGLKIALARQREKRNQPGVVKRSWEYLKNLVGM